ncbi:MAG: ABC transporter substrate-binding protein [Actinobacteria bacterium]|nr:ABC transporter substrate-binding protein [Actinomycetota bacterium]
MKRPDELLVAPSGPITRRRALRLGAEAAIAASALGGLAGCGVGSNYASEAQAGKPVRGGTLKLGMITGGTAETLNPGLVLGEADGIRTMQLFDRLFETYDDVKTLHPGLATSAESNKDATTWTLHLRRGVTWHDGKPFTADDVVWTFNTWSATSSYANQFVAGLVDFKQVRKLDQLTVIVPLLKGVAQFPSLLTQYNMGVIQNGATKADLSEPVGTGPFKYLSFTPGQQSLFDANRDYWDHRYPYVDQLLIDSSFTDETPRLNALLSGLIDVMPLVPANIARQYETPGQLKLLRAPSPATMLISMRIDQGPFADVRVRRAMRLAADRTALVEGALGGQGAVADDLIGKGCDFFAADLERPHDPEQAASLLKAAGQTGLSFTLPTSNVVPGYVESATLFAQQANEAGFDVKVENGPPATYFGLDYITRPIGQDNSISAPSLTQQYRTFFAPGGAYNTTHWGEQEPGGKAASKLISEAIAAVDPKLAAELWREVQVQQFEIGGQLGWGTIDALSLAAPNVYGLKEGPATAVDNGRLLTGWLA